jgi:hypothetical protein
MGMGTYVYPQSITIPANTASTSPHIVTPGIGDIWLDDIEFSTPSGNAGLVGFYVANNQMAICPFASPAVWLLSQDETLRYPIGVEVSTGLAIYTYNTDIQVHLLQVRLIGRPMVLQNPSSTQIAPAVLAAA